MELQIKFPGRPQKGGKKISSKHNIEIFIMRAASEAKKYCIHETVYTTFSNYDKIFSNFCLSKADFFTPRETFIYADKKKRFFRRANF